MPIKKKKAAWYDELSTMGVKIDHVTENNNVVVKKISAKSLKAVKAAGFKTRKMPSGIIVILHK